MPPIQIGPTHPARAVDARLASSAARPAPHGSESSAATSVVRSEALDPGAAPVDAERVALIRRAVEQGSYPVVPAKIADAMIAAGILLRNGK